MNKYFSGLSHFVFFFLVCAVGINAQEEPKQKKLKFQADARIRGEQDWNSQKSDGTFRDDRFRVRFLPLKRLHPFHMLSWEHVLDDRPETLKRADGLP